MGSLETDGKGDGRRVAGREATWRRECPRVTRRPERVWGHTAAAQLWAGESGLTWSIPGEDNEPEAKAGTVP